MSSAAEFFANKKKKKKTFKFNANKIDAATVTSLTHVDAPALSTDHDGVVTTVSSNVASLTLESNQDTVAASSEQWDDEALAATYVRKGASNAAGSSAVLDILALDPKRGEQDDIAEKMRVEETKARLAAAREGMEREAQRIKEERERKEQLKKEKEAGSLASTKSSSGLYVPSHLRNAGLMGRSTMGSSLRKQEFDVQDENLFPDLAAADAILEQQQKQQSQKLSKKAPTAPATGSAWLARRKAAAAAANDEAAKKSEAVVDQQAAVEADTAIPPPEVEIKEPKVNEAVAEADTRPAAVNEETKVDGGSEAVDKPAENATAAANDDNDDEESAAKIVRKKKKKKDLSTFGAS